MTREQAKEYIKNSLEGYLLSKGINTSKPFSCLNPEHADNNPSMSYDRKRNKVHCFSCNVDYDLLDLIGVEYGLSGNDIFLKAYELYNIHIDGENQNPLKIEQKTKENKSNIEYYRLCASRINETDYPAKRGISQEVLKRFMIGYDPAYKVSGGSWKALIIPTGEYSYTARNTDDKVDSGSRYRNMGASLIFNSKALINATKPIFIVEGELDALSIISVGGEAIALGSTANYRGLIKRLKENAPAQPLILALDNDQAGEETTTKIVEELDKLLINYYQYNPYGEYKDANEALLSDREALISAINSAEHIEEELKQAELEAYKRTSTAYYIQDFTDEIAESVNTPVISTGFKELDSVLDGGLYSGLYIMGAITSLGKTTYILQMADQIAQSGEDVLIFSLEMARSELMAKSISRHTIISVLSEGGDIRNAKTTRGITTGKRYVNYSNEERELIKASINDYSKYADNIYIHEGIGDIGAVEVRDIVKRHINITGKKPIVIIDYLQILAPYDMRATDKQNVDKATLELKRLSRDCNIPVIAVSSFNRQGYNQAVTLESFKESGGVEYGSDVLIGLQLEGVGSKNFDVSTEKQKNPRNVELVILKARNSATGGKISYEYYPLFNYFVEKSY